MEPAGPAARRRRSRLSEPLSFRTDQDTLKTQVHGCSCTGKVRLGVSDSSSTAQKCSSLYVSATRIGSREAAAGAAAAAALRWLWIATTLLRILSFCH